MTRFPLPLTQFIHENLSVVMCFVYSRRPLEKLMEGFTGEWKYLNKALFDYSEQRVQKACLELALFLRILDDEHKLSEHPSGTPACGVLAMKDGSNTGLTFRDAANKIIHATRFEFKIKDGEEPLLICHSRDEEKWLLAQVEIVALASFCGQLMS